MRKCLCIIFSLLSIALSNSTSAQQNTQEQSATAIQSIQTRTYQNSYREVFRALISVLQDNKYKISFTDMSAGIITASGSPQMKENMSAGVAFIPFVGGLLSMARQETTESWTVSATVEDLEAGRGILVRLVITSEQKSESMLGAAAEKAKAADLVKERPDVYQNLFSKLESALFVRSQTR
jgi:hypothetical protein